MRFFNLGIKNKYELEIVSIRERLAILNGELDHLCRTISKTQSENNGLHDRLSKLETTTAITAVPTKAKHNFRAEPRKGRKRVRK